MKYNHDEAIQGATEIFWQQGFHGTKMRDLQTKLDMRPGSIYAAFGSKENLFKLVIDCYVQQSVRVLDSHKDNITSPLEALKSFVLGQIFVDGDIRNCRMCLLVKTLSEAENSHQELTKLARSGLVTMQKKFTELFIEARNMNLIAQDCDCIKLGKWLQMQIMGLIIYAKGLGNPEEVNLMIEDIFSNIPTDST